MVLRTKKTDDLPIGLDLGSFAVKMVELRKTKEGLQLLAAKSQEIPRNCREDLGARMEYLGRCVRSMLKETAFKTRRCVLSLPAENTFVHHLKLPKLTPKELPEAIERELAAKLPYPVADAIVRYMVAGDVFGDGEPKQEVIAVAARKETIDQFLTLSRRAKLDVMGISVEPCAIASCFGQMLSQAEPGNSTTLYVDIGGKSTQAVLTHGPNIAFARNLDFGGRLLDKEIAKVCEVSIEDASQRRLQRQSDSSTDQPLDEVLGGPIDQLTKELTQCMRYHESVFPNQGVARLVFLGGQAYDKRLCQTIAQKLNLVAQIGDPFAHISRQGATSPTGDLHPQNAQPDWAVAVGLSLSDASAA